jgi:hypothetical protein
MQDVMDDMEMGWYTVLGRFGNRNAKRRPRLMNGLPAGLVVIIFTTR